MALIGKIREKTGLAIGVIAFGLILFLVGGDILSPNSTLLGGQDNNVGEIAGNKISIQEFQQKVEEFRFSFVQQNGYNPSETQLSDIRNRAWEFLIVKYAFQKQYDKLGIEVTEEELVDMIQGKNVNPEIRQAFSNPETGEFDKEQLLMYLQQLGSLPANQRAQWISFEQSLLPSRLRLKYDNLAIRSTFVNKEEAKRKHQEENTVADFDYLYVPYFAIPDSLIQISDSDLRDFLKRNESMYEQEAGRSISYVNFRIVPSSQDSAVFLERMEDLKKEFGRAADDSSFAFVNTEGGSALQTVAKSRLPNDLKNTEDLQEGEVYGPFQSGSNYTIYKVSAVLGNAADSVEARHILFSTQGLGPDEKESEREKAEGVLNQLRAGGDFAVLAAEYGSDGTAQQGGDLGYFTRGRMVPAFEKAVFVRTNTGLLPELVETNFGFHIIDVTDIKFAEQYKIASIRRELFAGDEAIDDVYRKADNFASSASKFDDFVELAKQMGVNVERADGLRKNQSRIRGLNGSRNAIQWAFRDAKIGHVSDVFDIDQGYMVAVLTSKNDEGTASVDQVREDLRRRVTKEKKAQIIVDKLNSIDGTLEDKMAAYGDANQGNIPSQKMGASSISGVGYASKSLGKLFALESGETSEPAAEEGGVLIVRLNNITEAPEVADYSSSANVLISARRSQISQNLSDAIKKHADIVDKRYRFF
ncbi:MAG: SurA N-terminal domain-containing protein [Cyclobacteriaceae bacterium]|nr:SurA N-terminal domain-containing protein [Cyclobacteriaceae bacterium]MCH8515496.1 SurA N-terminal domain-containing protein [Cyclobacteriaceae bacterium]